MALAQHFYTSSRLQTIYLLSAMHLFQFRLMEAFKEIQAESFITSAVLMDKLNQRVKCTSEDL